MRRIGSFVLMASCCLAFFTLIASPASGEIEGPCSASFNGIPFDDLDTPSEARERLVIQPGESVILRATVPDTDFVYVDVLFPPLTITLAEFEADEPSDQGSDVSEVEGEIPLGDLATYGAGIFQFVGRTDDCWGNAYFVIGGVEPWETAVGKTAIGVAGVGILIGLTSWIPAIVAGGGGVVRSVIAGGPIGLGVAVVIQQAGLVPLSATSVGVAVLGSSVVAVFVTKGLAGISGALTGGGAASGAALPTPPPTSPPAASVGAASGSPPPPGETPMPTAQDVPAPPGPEKIFVDDASLLGGEVTPVPDATLTPQPPEVPVQGGELTPGPDRIFVDDAGLFGGEITPVPDATLTPQPPEVPVQGGELTPGPEKIFVDDAGLLGGEVTPVPDATLTPQPPEVPVQDAVPTSGAPPAAGMPSAGAASAPAPGGPAQGSAPTSPATGTPSSTVTGAPSSPATGAPTSPATGAPTSPAAGSSTAATPPGGASPASGGAPPPSTGTATPGAASPPPGATSPPPGPGGAGTVGGSGVGLAAGAAAAAGVAGLASRAAAARKRAMSGGPACDPYWFYVSAPTDMYGIDNYETVIARLVPGTWYTAVATYDEWVHAFDEPSGFEGWVAKDVVMPFEA